MTDAGSPGTEWVPRFGMLEVSSERAALIRGLFELAAWVAEHPDLPLPAVNAGISAWGGGFAAEVAEVERIAESLGVAAGFAPSGSYVAQRRFGTRVRMLCAAHPRRTGGADADSSSTVEVYVGGGER